LCFLDYYSGYYQIALKVSDQRPGQDGVHNAAQHLLPHGHDFWPQECWSGLLEGHPEVLRVPDWQERRGLYR
jgi:hypothetical protein